MRQAEKGYFLVISIILILVIGVLGSLIAYLVGGRAMIAPAELQGMQAFYLAESGLEVAARQLVGVGVNNPPTCDTLTGTAVVTNTNLLNGTFTATAVNNALYSTSTTLSAAITASTATIPLTSTSGFAEHGRVRIDNEAINYAGISGGALVGVFRGAGGTTAASHSSGAVVSENICLVQVNAGIPSIASPSYRRTVEAAVEILAGGDAWVVSDRSGNAFNILRWGNPTPGSWNNYSITDSSNRTNLNAVSMYSQTYGWAVGNENNDNFTLLNFGGTSWSLAAMSGACSSQNLKGVSVVSPTEAWAVGSAYRAGCASGGKGPYTYRYTILKWNGSTWTVLAPSTIPSDSTSNQDLNAVSLVDTSGNGLANIGFAVGLGGKILKYNGTSWVADTSPTSADLYGVSTVSASEAWAVGANGTMLRWNGTSWGVVSSPTSTQLNAIRMTSTSGGSTANLGWAVGNSGTILYYNGSTWTVQQSSGNNLYGVGVGSSSFAWAVGAANTILRWNGSSWVSTASPLSGNPQLNAVVVTKAGPGSSGSLVGSWKQVFR